MLVPRLWSSGLLLAAALLLSGCGPAVSSASFVGNLSLFFLAFVTIASALQPHIINRSLTIGASAVMALVLAVLVVVVLPEVAEERKWKWRAGSNDLGQFAALMVFAVIMVLGGSVAAILVQFGLWISLCIFLVSSLALASVWLVFVNNYFSKGDTYLEPIGVALFGVWSGCLLAIGWFYQSKAVPLLVLGAGLAGASFLVYRAWLMKQTLPRIGTYAVAIILSYELWLFGKALVLVWK